MLRTVVFYENVAWSEWVGKQRNRDELFLYCGLLRTLGTLMGRLGQVLQTV